MGNLMYGSINSVGPYKNQVGWVDFSPVGPLSIGQSYTLTCGIPGVGSISFTLTNQGPIAQTQSSGDGKITQVYYGLGGSLAFGSTRDNSNTITINISNINVVANNGTPISNYKILTADAETTVSGEYWEMTTDGGAWVYEGITPAGSSMGDPQISGLGTNDYKETGFSSGATSPIISSQGARNLTFKSMNNATQLFDLGLYIPGNITITKAVDKAYANRGDTLTYTIVLNNTTFANATNVILRDSISNNTTFVQNSLTINGATSPQSIMNPITVPDVLLNTQTTIKFQVIVNNNTSFYKIPNTASVTYISAGNNGALTSNTVNTYVYEPQISISKTANSMLAHLGDTITYTLIMQNTGTTIVSSVYLFDTIPDGTNFISNSVLVNSVANSGSIGVSPGVLVGSINANATSTISFQVSVVSVPNGNIITNEGIFKYSYLNTSLNRVTVTTITNLVTIPVQYINVQIYKSVDRAYANRGDILNYTITIPNIGNTDGTNVVLIDSLPKNTSYVPASLTINGASSTQGIGNISLNDILAGTMTTVTFSVIINNNTTFNSIPNTGYLNFTAANSSKSIVSNPVLTYVYEPQISINKSANTSLVHLGDTITYTLVMQNTGTTIVNSVYVFDIIPDGTNFISNSVLVDNQSNTGNIGINPGILIGEIDTNVTRTVSFQVNVVSIPIENFVSNDGVMTYSYVDTALDTVTTSATSNLVTIPIQYIKLDIYKNVDKKYAKRGDIIKYTITIPNTGNRNATNVVLIDTLPNHTTLAPNSLMINGVASNQSLGNISLSDIEIGAITTVTFSLIADNDTSFNSIPNIAYLKFISDGINEAIVSNSVLTYVYQPKMSITKSGNTIVTQPGLTVTYNIFIQNTGTTIVNNVYVIDTIPQGSNLVQGSTTINGVPVGIGNIGVSPGILLPNIDINEGKTVTFQVLVYTVPKNNELINSGLVQYSYTNNPAIGVINEGLNSNTVTIPVRFVQVSTQKFVDKRYVARGDILNYMILITNSGNAPANDILVTDTIPYWTTFVNNSLSINGNPSSQNINGLVIPTINGYSTITVTFQVTVN